jgi:uncharacterized protein
MRLLRRGAGSGQITKVFYGTDLHGSEVVWRKFLNAAKFYDVDALVCGGDLMGKVVVPIVRRANGRREADFQGKVNGFDNDDEVAAMTTRLQTLGQYWYECDEDEYAAIHGNEDRIEELFTRLASERLSEWVQLAEERLAGTHVRCFLTGGNDDTDEVLRVLDHACQDHVVAAEGRLVNLDDTHTMVSLGYSTPTPWKTPREATDPELAKMISDVMIPVADPSRCVFNFHVPPLDSTLDTCLELDETVWPPTPVLHGGQPVEYGAGSAAVRDALGTYQPLIGLHGHIHESRGATKYGHTPAVNPGSEYGEGVLRGAIVSLRDDHVTGTQFTSG